MKNRYATVYFMVEDVLDYFPEMSRRQATKWLEQHESEIQVAMREVGYEYIEQHAKQ